ncbi:MAG: hypothetical protein PHO20_04530 [Candidatus Peribacteraceae bacterium]|nr:hypothetical protein [Candidatus Peribacteraceae bacterium]MDD5740006.1 hypothetical protein [Candidatus Peribacteraceae bacterium]
MFQQGEANQIARDALFAIMKFMKMNFFPKSLLGKCAVGLGIVLVATIALELLFAAAIGGDPAVIEANPLLSILATALAVTFSLAAPLSSLFGIITIIKNREWSVCKPWGCYTPLPF